MRSTSTVSRIHAARHHGFAGTVDSGGETTWVTRPDYEGNPHHGLVTTALRRAAASLVVVGAALMLIPAAASAHALLASASPKPGAHLGTAPGVVVLEFSQTLNAQLSHATLTDPTGHRWNGEVDSGEEIRIPLATNASGVYTVDWTTVSQVDGHLITGSFTFDVGVVGSGSSQEAANAVPGPAASDIAIGTVKWVEALALLFLVGQVLVGGLARRAPPLEWVQPRFRAASVALSAGLVVVWAEATVGSGGHSISGYLSYFGAGLSGAALIARLGFEALALVAVVRGWWTLPLWLAGALAMLAAGGHAAGVQPAWIGIGLDAVHLAAAGLWAGGIAALASVRPPGGWRSSEARALIRRFSPVALGAFGATVVAGGLEAVMQLGSVQSLVGTAYGRVLIAKMALVALMLPLSVMAWRLGRPKVRIEAAIAVCVVAAAALLASFPAPPSAAAEKAAELASATPSAGLPSPGALTMAGPAGSVLVGLSLSPGKPGPNRALVYLVPITGTAAAAALPANIAVNGVYKALGSCGDTCRTATVDIQSGDAVAIDVLGVGGGEAKFVMPKLPAPSGSALLSRMQSAMHTLTAYQATEVLSSGITTIRSVYASDAPDRTTWTVGGTGQTIWIDTTQYTRTGASDPWHKETDLPANTVPYFVWDYFEPLSDAHVLGNATLDGVPTTVVSSFGNKQATAIWFTFWIDGSGRVRQVEMDAPGHFMTDTYTSYDHPVDIVAPPLG